MQSGTGLRCIVVVKEENVKGGILGKMEAALIKKFQFVSRN